MAQSQTPSWDSLSTAPPAGATPAAAAPVQAPAAPATPTSVQLKPNWDSLSLIKPPPSTEGLPKLGGPPDPRLTFARDYAAPIIGSIAGATVGGRLASGANILGRTLFGATGGAIGGGGGSVVGDVLAHDPAAPHTNQQILDRAALETVTGAAGEVGVGLGSAVLSGLKTIPAQVISRTARRTSTPETRDAVAWLSQLGGRPTPHQLGRSSWLDIMQNVTEGSPFSRNEAQHLYAQNEAAMIREVRRLLSEYGPTDVTQTAAGEALRTDMLSNAVGDLNRVTAAQGRRGAEMLATPPPLPPDLGPLTQQIGPAAPAANVTEYGQRLIRVAEDQAKAAANTRYEKLWKTVDDAGVRISPTALVDRAESLLREAGEVGAVSGLLGRAKPELKALAKLGEVADDTGAELAERAQIPGWDAIQQRINNPNVTPTPAHKWMQEEYNAITQDLTDPETGEVVLASMTPKQLNRLRSFYGRVADESTGPVRSQFSALAQSAEDTLITALGGLDSPAVRELDLADAQYKIMRETFSEGVLAEAAKADPKKFVNYIIGAKHADPNHALLARNVLEHVEPGAWEEVQRAAWAKLTQHGDGTPLPPKAVLANLRRFKDEHITAIFGTEHGANILATKGPLDVATAPIPKWARTPKAPRTPKGPDPTEPFAAEVRRLQEANPYTFIANTLNNAGGPEIEKIKKIVGGDSSPTWQQVQRLKMQEWFTSDNPEVMLTGKQLFQRLPDREQLVALVGEQRANYLNQFARHMQTLEAAGQVGGGQGKMAIQLQTPGAVMAVVGGGLAGNWKLAGTGGLILFTPHLLGKIAMSPEMGRALIGGMAATARHDPGTALRFTNQLMAQMIAQRWVTPDGKEIPDIPATTPPTAQGAGTIGAPPPIPLGSTSPGRLGGPGARAGQPPPQFVTPPPYVPGATQTR